MYDYRDARQNAEKVAKNIFDMKLQTDALDDGEFWIFPWDEETDENPICVNKRIGGICLYDPEAHPAFRDAVLYQP